MEAEEEGEVAAARVSVVTAALLSHLRAFLSCLAFEVLSHGNLSSTSVAAFTETLEGMCRWPPSTEGGVGRAVTKLPQGTAIVLSQAPRNPLEPSLCCEVYYQLGPYNDRSVVLLDLLEAVLEEPFFDQLRTKQQLGYSVGCGCKNTFGVVGFAFSVVSSSFSMAHVQAAILAFAEKVPALIRNMPKADWKDHLEALISEKQAPDTALSGAAAFNWDEISDQRFDFASRAKHARMLADVSKEDLASLAEELLAPATRKLLSVQVQVDGEPVPVSASASGGAVKGKGKGKGKGKAGKSTTSASAADDGAAACSIVTNPEQVWATCEVQQPSPRGAKGTGTV
jgi:nardilysin